ncbi:MAG: hypothetical protein JWO91_3866 [Acidobacteriaceae bacterium]|nr:hypothetical protein [Acidobacteriaceae bacterium]
MNALTPSKGALIAGLMLFIWCNSVEAQEKDPLSGQDGNWDISLWVAGATGEETRNSFTQAQIWTAGVFLGKVISHNIGNSWWHGSLEYGLDLVPLFVASEPEKLYGGGFEPVVLRWNGSHHLGRLQPYVELVGGGVFTSANLPAGDTSNFNFTARGGGGCEVFARKRQALDIGLRYWHISNANLGVRNPEFNGVQISLGYHWFR